MKNRLKNKLLSMDPPGNLLWFYKKYVSHLGFGFGYFTMMLSGTRTMRDDTKDIIDEFINKG